MTLCSLSTRLLETQKPLEMTTAVALESTFRSASADVTTSSVPTCERTCWRSLGLFFRSVWFVVQGSTVHGRLASVCSECIKCLNCWCFLSGGRGEELSHLLPAMCLGQFTRVQRSGPQWVHLFVSVCFYHYSYLYSYCYTQICSLWQ